MDRSVFQSSLALQLASFSASFRIALAELRVGPNDYTPDMTSPEGLSTGGGAQATQHVLLLSPQPSLPKLVVGLVNKPEGTAELRTWEYLETLWRGRFNQGAPVDRESYGQFLQSAQGFLVESGLRVSLSSTPDGNTGSYARPGSNALGLALIAFGLLGALAAAIVWLFVLKH